MKVRFIQVGMGGWGRDWASFAIPRVDEVAPVAWVDASAETLALARERLGLPEDRCFPSLEQAFAAVDADAVLITASLPGHVPLAQAALEAGKHVLIEKPFAPTLAEAQQLIDTANRRGRVLMISQNYRFFPAVRAAASLVRERTMGDLGMIKIDFRRYANTAPRGNHRHYTLRQPLLMDMSIHHFDLLRLITGSEPRRVSCYAWNPPWSNFDEPAAAVADITFENGVVVSYRGSWVSPGPQTPWAGIWSMECSNGEIDWTSRGGRDLSADRVRVRAPGGGLQRVELPALKYFGRAGCLAAFAQAIVSGTEPECSGRDNLRSLALMFAMIESATRGMPIDVADLLTGATATAPLVR